MPGYDLYLQPNDLPRNNGEADSPMTTAGDYDFSNKYEQPPFLTPLQLNHNTDYNKARILTDSDVQANIATAALAASSPLVQRYVEDKLHLEPKIPSTYDVLAFSIDTNAAYASGKIRTAWLELYYQQMKSGDFPPIRENSVDDTSKQTSQLVPRALSDRLPDGTAAEGLELFLTPELYYAYKNAGLIPNSPGGENGVPRLYWILLDGDTYRAGTNATSIFLTPDMNVLSAATQRGTYRSVKSALSEIPDLCSTREQDAKDENAKKAAELKRTPLYA
jgi:hypothetical protein